MAVRPAVRAPGPVSRAGRISAGDRGCRGAARAAGRATRRAGPLLVHGARGRGLPGHARRRLPERGHLLAEIGDVRRFETPRQLMAYLGLVPSESSTGEQVRRGGITKAGNGRARRVVIQGAWTYRFPARKSRLLEERQAGLPKAVRDIAWKAQLRLCGRYRKLMARGKRYGVVVT